MTEQELIEKISYALSIHQCYMAAVAGLVQQDKLQERSEIWQQYQKPFQQGWQKFFQDPLPRAASDKDFWKNLGIDDLMGPSSGPKTD
jgi:hypothetical protein